MLDHLATINVKASALLAGGHLVEQSRINATSIERGDGELRLRPIRPDGRSDRTIRDNFSKYSRHTALMNRIRRRTGLEDFEYITPVHGANMKMPMNGGEGSRHVGFAPEPGYSRLPRVDEEYVMEHFHKHAIRCDDCHDPYKTYKKGGTLCDQGHRLAQDVAGYMYSKGGRAYSMLDRESLRQRVQVEIPPHCDKVRGLLQAVDHGLRVQKPGALKSQDKNYYVPSRPDRRSYHDDRHGGPVKEPRRRHEEERRYHDDRRYRSDPNYQPSGSPTMTATPSTTINLRGAEEREESLGANHQNPPLVEDTNPQIAIAHRGMGQLIAISHLGRHRLKGTRREETPGPLSGYIESFFGEFGMSWRQRGESEAFDTACKPKGSSWMA
ncbi:hypothetical protein GJ744_001151 [Endocarpon pusillum]|uniref:Uncharacterized protein n=1 Tax=Endocarpon pusillum TaxID=364733 RepID=A0A8H7ADS4_9EURO|nr:hypothetical protein GJ744_001151 [Endocarpon pusillum]